MCLIKNWVFTREVKFPACGADQLQSINIAIFFRGHHHPSVASQAVFNRELSSGLPIVILYRQVMLLVKLFIIA